MTTETMDRSAHRTNLLNWLDAQFPGGLGALTGTDVDALLASEAIANLWLRTRSQGVASSFLMCVEEMQPKTRYFAYHVVAFQGDWSHRAELWTHAGLRAVRRDAPHAAFSPEGSVAAGVTR